MAEFIVTDLIAVGGYFNCKVNGVYYFGDYSYDILDVDILCCRSFNLRRPVSMQVKQAIASAINKLSI